MKKIYLYSMQQNSLYKQIEEVIDILLISSEDHCLQMIYKIPKIFHEGKMIDFSAEELSKLKIAALADSNDSIDNPAILVKCNQQIMVLKGHSYINKILKENVRISQHYLVDLDGTNLEYIVY